MLQLNVDRETLRPLVEEIVTEIIEQTGGDPMRIAYSEREAAALLGLAPHQLRDRRLEGKVNATRIGKEYRYTRAALLALLHDDRNA